MYWLLRLFYCLNQITIPVVIYTFSKGESTIFFSKFPVECFQVLFIFFIFTQPIYLAADSADFVYVADCYVKVFTYSYIPNRYCHFLIFFNTTHFSPSSKLNLWHVRQLLLSIFNYHHAVVLYLKYFVLGTE